MMSPGFRRLTAMVVLAWSSIGVTAPAKIGYADLAALGLGAPVILRATIEKAVRIDAAQVPDVAPGLSRQLIFAATTAAIVAPGEIPPRFQYLLDVPLDDRGKIPRLKGADVLLFLRPAANMPGSFTLITAHGQIAWTPEIDAQLRSILIEGRGNTVPVITGITSAFRVPGAVPGEAESQFFVATADGKPVSLVVLTRPDLPQRLAIALGDVIDDAAPPIKRDTLLWYRLACFLPKALPATVKANPDVASDYRFVLASLGPCNRTL